MHQKRSIIKAIRNREKDPAKRQARRDSIRTANINAYTHFNQIYVNDKPYPKASFNFAKHHNNQEQGLMAIIPTTEFKDGENILEIRKDYYYKDKIQKIVRIPFYFERQ